MKPMKFILQRVKLDRAGYTSLGRYYGVGMPLYWFSSDHGEGYLRAAGRAEAKRIIRQQYPKAKFYR